MTTLIDAENYMTKKIVQDFLYEKETYLIRGACFKVWQNFGGAFKEKIVDRALSEELKKIGLKVEDQKKIDIYYNEKKIGIYVIDKVINNTIIIEVKCKSYLTKEDERQFWLYLKGSKYKVGLLINFGSEKLEIRRRIYDKAREKRDFSVLQRSYQHISASKGFTIMEVLVAIAVFVLATFAIAVFITQSFKVQNFSLEQSTAIDEARRGVETMVKELREALPGDTGAYPIELANPQELIFYADYDRDAAIEKVHYWLSGSDFKKGVIEASGVLLQYSGTEEVEIISRYVRNATTPILTYRDSNYGQLATPADPDEVKLIHVYLRINVTSSRPPTDYELESDVSLRNLKENL